MTKRIFAAILLTALLAVPAQAQFNSLGTEKASIKWNQTVTDNYRVIYPVGLDSLGTRYASLLEYYSPLVGASAKFLPNQQYRTPMPVVLHPYGAVANGAVTWAPRRMVLFTFPDASGSIAPVPWETLLSIHENRHVAQWQFGRSGFFKWLSYPLGEQVSLYAAALFEESSLAEGDAVVAETALTASGRGRTADFLSYYRMSFDQGDFRNWYRWRYRSQKHYTPDYYRIGYMSAAGGRVMTGDPRYALNYLYSPFSPRKLNRSWKDISAVFATRWAEDDVLRGPFQAVVPLVEPGRYYTVVSSVVETKDGRVYAIRASLDRTEDLVEILPDGSVRSIRPMATDSKLVYSPLTDCLYWNEVAYSRRWDFQQDARIKKMEAGSRRIHDFTKKGKYVNPAVSENGKYLSAAEYLTDGRSRIVLFELDPSREVARIPVPDGLQVTEMAFSGNKLIFTGIEEGGMGLYRTDFHAIEMLEAPQPYKIKDMISHGGKVWFTADRTGTNEIYSLADGELVQHSNTRYGVSHPYFQRDSLRFVALTPSGKLPASADSPFEQTVSFADHASYPVADILTAQEQSLEHAVPVTEIPAPARYSQATHFFHFHSWLPFWYDSDGFQATRTDYTYQRVSGGAMAFFQNLTGTVSGTLGLSVHEDPFKKDAVATGFHARMRYTGWYPVIDLSLDAGDRSSALLLRSVDSAADSVAVDVQQHGSHPYIGGKIGLSVPLNFSSGGWQRSLEPFASVAASTDLLGAYFRYLPYNESQDYNTTPYWDLQAGFRWSDQLPVANSTMYPRLGIGGTLKTFFNPLSSGLYMHAYGFLPGLASTHGLKIALSAEAKTQHISYRGNYMNPQDVWALGQTDLTPRGYEKTDVGALLSLYAGSRALASVDYAMPVLSADLALGSLFYLRNLEFIPFVDFMVTDDIWNNGSLNYLYSAGADLLLRFEKFLLFSNTMHLGIRAAYNDGSLFDTSGLKSHAYCGFVFQYSL